MRWPWRRPSADTDEAQRHLDRLARQQPEVRQLTRELAAARERNHFSESIARALAARVREREA